MSLIEPFWDKVKPYKKWFIYGGLGVLLLGVALFLYDCGDNYLFKSKVQKQKDEIANTVQDIKGISNQIIELEKEKAVKTAEVNAATVELQNNIFGRDEAKTETNQALVNLQRAVNSNTNVDRSAADLQKILEKLGNE